MTRPGHASVPALVTPGHGGDDGAVTAPAEPSDAPFDLADAVDSASTEERGSFTHGVCRVCGWTGPGRRSRERARDDVAAHGDGNCPV